MTLPQSAARPRAERSRPRMRAHLAVGCAAWRSSSASPLIERRSRPPAREVALGIGDDAAVLAPSTRRAGVDRRRAGRRRALPPRPARARKTSAIARSAAALSDLAAMGARPRRGAAVAGAAARAERRGAVRDHRRRRAGAARVRCVPSTRRQPGSRQRAVDHDQRARRSARLAADARRACARATRCS